MGQCHGGGRGVASRDPVLCDGAEGAARAWGTGSSLGDRDTHAFFVVLCFFFAKTY